VLRGTPKALHCRERDAPALRKVLWIGDPHWELTIEAATGLSTVGTPAKVTKSVTHKGSKYVVEPRITRKGVSEGELGTDDYPAAANQCREVSIAAEPFVACRRTVGKLFS
jgi:hypothetical protein